MGAIEAALRLAIFMALGIPVWILALFVVGWFFDKQARDRSMSYLEQRRRSMKEKMERWQ